jgi:hypothetical protein
MGDYMVKPLGVDTWDAFARLVERHNGVFGPGGRCPWQGVGHREVSRGVLCRVRHEVSPLREDDPGRGAEARRAAVRSTGSA